MWGGWGDSGWGDGFLGDTPDMTKEEEAQE